MRWYSSEFTNIFQSYSVFYGIKQNSKYKITIKNNFIQFHDLNI